jgi:hypothetical protein
MPTRYYDYHGRPVRMTVDAKDIPELTEAWDAEQKKLVENNWIETDIFNGAPGARLISEEEFEALLKRLRA